MLLLHSSTEPLERGSTDWWTSPDAENEQTQDVQLQQIALIRVESWTTVQSHPNSPNFRSPFDMEIDSLESNFMGSQYTKYLTTPIR